MTSSASRGEMDTSGFDPVFARRLGRVLRRLTEVYFGATVDGLQHIPRGPFLGVGTHNGSVLMPDMFAWFARYFTEPLATPLRVMAHDLLIDAPGPLARTFARMGAVRAGPGAAERLLAEGHAVMVYPGGDFDAEKPFWRRHQVCFAGRLGYARLAIRAQVPIVPVVSVGGHETLLILWDGAPLARWLGLARRKRLQVFPLMLALPWGLFLGVPPFYLPLPAHIELRALPPILPPPDPALADDDAAVRALDAQVRVAMQDALDAMSRGRLPIVGRRLRRARGDRAVATAGGVR